MSNANRGFYFNKDGTVEYLNANKESVKSGTYTITDISSDGNSATITVDVGGTITEATATFTSNNELKIVEDGQSLILHTD